MAGAQDRVGKEAIAADTALRRVLQRTRGNPLTRLGLVIVGVVILVALLAPWLAPYDPYAIDLKHRLLLPSATHPAGTDEVGRDLLSRILYGARTSLLVGFAVVGFGATIGTVIGSLSGLIGGRVDSAIMRLMDVIMALPGLVIAIALTAALGPGLINAALALGLIAVPVYTRLARGQTLSLRHQNYVRAAELAGASTAYVVRKHILPNVIACVAVLATLDMGGAILATASLSFIGLGAQPPIADWGSLINGGKDFIFQQRWYALTPGFAIALTVLGFNFLGDGLRDALDPRSAKL